MGTIVFCEDDPAIQRLVRVALRPLAHRLLIAGDGAEGLALVIREHPALVLTDVLMPGMSGLELCRAIKTNAALAHTPVVLVTASAQRTQIEEGLRQGAADVLMKPFTLDALRGMVAKHARG